MRDARSTSTARTPSASKTESHRGAAPPSRTVSSVSVHVVAVARLAHRLLGVAAQPLAQARQAVERPLAEHGLPQRAEPGSRAGGASCSSSSSARSQWPGSSASTAMRARTSSPRLVSWVDSVTIASGQSRCRSAIAAWKSSTPITRSDGSPPTSLSEAAATSGRASCPPCPWPSPGRRSAGSARAGWRHSSWSTGSRTSYVAESSGRSARAAAKALLEVLATLGEVGPVDREAGEQLGDGVGASVARRSPGDVVSSDAGHRHARSAGPRSAGCASATARLLSCTVRCQSSRRAAQAVAPRGQRRPRRPGRRATRSTWPAKS